MSVMTTRACEHCGADITHKRRDARVCNRACKEQKRHAAKGVPKRSTGGVCKFEGCDKPWKARQLCQRHYQRLTKYGSPGATKGHDPDPERDCLACGADISHRKSNAVVCSKECKNTLADRRRNKSAGRISQKHGRRAWKLGSESVPVTGWEWDRIKRQLDGRCAYCHAVTPAPQMDHIIPLSRGGRHAPANVAPACGPCNLSKSNLFLVEWRFRAAEGR